jgi:hypothetical protein
MLFCFMKLYSAEIEKKNPSRKLLNLPFVYCLEALQTVLQDAWGTLGLVLNGLRVTLNCGSVCVKAGHNSFCLQSTGYAWKVNHFNEAI